MQRGRGGGSRGKFTGSSRKFPRVARVNESLREVIAEEIEQLDDDRLFLCTVTGVDVDPDFRHATVFFSVMDPTAGERAAETQAALEENRVVLQKAVGRELTLKRTPLLSFVPDSGVANGAKIEAIISVMPRSPEDIDYGVDENGVGLPSPEFLAESARAPYAPDPSDDRD